LLLREIELMTALIGLAGLALVLLALVDLITTTVAAGSGGGPLTTRLAPALWQAALVVYRRSHSHEQLSVAGVLIVLVVLVIWLMLVLAGWWLVFLSSPAAVVTSDTGAPADAIARLYYAGSSMFTLGNADYRPGSAMWQIATLLSTASGLVLVTLAVTYLVPVASAVSERRAMANYIASLGDSPHDLLMRAWNGKSFGSLTQHLVALAALLHAARQRHLTYPVLHYFHSPHPEGAAAVNVVLLAQAIHLLKYGVAPDHAPDQAALDAVDRSVSSFLETLATAFIAPIDDPLPFPPLAPLRDAGIPTVSDDEYEQAMAKTEPGRRLMAGFLEDDGWAPVAVATTDEHLQPDATD
jgi:hypothetical protein